MGLFPLDIYTLVVKQRSLLKVCDYPPEPFISWLKARPISDHSLPSVISPPSSWRRMPPLRVKSLSRSGLMSRFCEGIIVEVGPFSPAACPRGSLTFSTEGVPCALAGGGDLFQV